MVLRAALFQCLNLFSWFLLFPYYAMLSLRGCIYLIFTANKMCVQSAKEDQKLFCGIFAYENCMIHFTFVVKCGTHLHV